MNVIIKYTLKMILVLTVLLTLGCATTTYYHTSIPPLKTIETPVFNASFEPIKSDSDFFSSFMLTITNKTDHSIEIDWNKTHYFHNKKNLGNFVFKGIEPSDVKNAAVPNDTIQANSQFSKKISPFSMIAFSKVKKYDASNKDSLISAGLLPEGLNSIAIIINNNGEMIKKIISVVIKEEKK